MMIAGDSSSDNEKHGSGENSSSSEGIKTQTEASMKKEEGVLHPNEKRVQADDTTSYFAIFKDGKSRSHENLTSLKTDEAFIWLQLVCNNKNTDFSIKKLNDLSIKLKQMGGPEYIKSKIKRYLKRIPNQFSADDKYGQKIRKKIPNYIVTKLKKFFDKLEKNSVDISTLMDIMKEDKNDMKTKSLRTILKTWVETIPMKQDAKKSIYNSLLDRFQGLLLHQPKNQNDFKDLLRSTIFEIAQQIPLDDVVKNQKHYFENIVQNLIEKVEKQIIEKSYLNLIITESLSNICLKNIFDNSNNIDFKVQNEILEWIQGLSFTIDNFGRHAIKSLASDIEARRKHLELNQSQKGTEEEELEILKFVIFKRLEKVDAEDTNKIIANIPQLMQRLNKLYKRIHSNAPCVSSAKSYTVVNNSQYSGKQIVNQSKTDEKMDTFCNNDDSCQVVSQSKMNEESGILCNTKTHRGENKSVSARQIIQVNNKTVNVCASDYNQENEITPEAILSQVTTNNNKKPDNWNTDNHQNVFHKQVCSTYTREPSCSYQEKNAKIDSMEDDIFYFYKANYDGKSKKKRNVWNIYQSNDSKSYKKGVVTASLAETIKNTRRESNSIIADFPEENNLAKIYEYFNEVFKKHCDDLPFDELTPEQNVFAIESKGKVYKGIWKIYLKLKSDPSIESDYSLFSDIFKDELNNLLKFLPKREPLEAFKMLWITNVLKDVMNLLKYVHSLTGLNSYKEVLAEKFDRKFVKQYNYYLSNKIQYIYIAKTIDIFILFMRYKQNDRKRANVYKKRFIAKLEELVDHVQYELGYQQIDKKQFCKDVFKALNSVPLPDQNKLEQEADEALIRDEIEIWYNELPVETVENELDNVLRNGEREELAKVLHIIENEFWPDTENICKKMIQEVIWFLQVDAHLNPEYEGHINLFAEDLVRRLQNRNHRVLDENALENSLNQSMNNATIYLNSTYPSVMPVLVQQRINTQQSLSNEDRNDNFSKDELCDNYNAYNDKIYHTAEESDSNISEHNKNFKEVRITKSKDTYEKSQAKQNILNPEIVNAKNLNYVKNTVSSDDDEKLSMQQATLVEDTNTSAYQTELVFDDKTNLYKPRPDKLRRYRH